MGDAILVIDEGTSSTRAALVDAKGRVGEMRTDHANHGSSQPGWVEQDAEEIGD